MPPTTTTGCCPANSRRSGAGAETQPNSISQRLALTGADLRTGRKRKDNKSIVPPTREQNGRLARLTTVEQIAMAERERQQKEMAVVLAQPHRQGNAGQLAECHLGRFCEKHRLRRELFDAGLEYAGMKRRWLCYHGARFPERITGNGFAVATDEDAARWKKRIEEMEHAIVRGHGALRAIEDLCIYDQQPSMFVHNVFIIKGLLALAIECGRLDAKALAR
jgi:hypothetical protein